MKRKEGKNEKENKPVLGLKRTHRLQNSFTAKKKKRGRKKWD